MVIEISVAAMALAVIVFVIFMIRTLINLNQTIQKVNQTLEGLHGKVEQAVTESTKTLEETRHLVEDLRLKSQQVDHVLNSVREVGKQMEEVSTSLARSAVIHRDRWGNVIALVGAGLEIMKEWRKDR